MQTLLGSPTIVSDWASVRWLPQLLSTTPTFPVWNAILAQHSSCRLRPVSHLTGPLLWISPLLGIPQGVPQPLSYLHPSLLPLVLVMWPGSTAALDHPIGQKQNSRTSPDNAVHQLYPSFICCTPPHLLHPSPTCCTSPHLLHPSSTYYPLSTTPLYPAEIL